MAVQSTARSAVGGVARLAARRSIAVANHRLLSSGTHLAAAAVTFRSERAERLFEAHEPEIIFIRESPATIKITAQTAFATNVLCSVRDVESGDIEYKESFYAAGDAGRPFNFNIRELPFTGIKYLHGIQKNQGAQEFSSEKFMVVSQDEVEFT